MVILYMVHVLKVHTRVSDKLAYANSADLMEQFDQGLHYTVFAICLSISGNNCMELSVRKFRKFTVCCLCISSHVLLECY